MKHIFILSILLIVSGMSYAQFTQNLRGSVSDADSKTTLPGATVMVVTDSGEKKYTITNSEGMFEINSIPIGRVEIHSTFIGYEPFMAKNIEIISGKEKIIDIELTEQVVKIDEIAVVARGRGETNNVMAALSARSFSVRETEKYAGSLGDPARMASNFAGVITANDSRNDIIIRGNSPQGLLWKLDGVVIPNPNHFGALGSTGGPVCAINNNLLANSDFFTSAFPAEYGNATSGVFDLKLRNGNNKKHEFLLQAGFSGLEAGTEGPISKNGASYLINYRYSVPALIGKIGFDISGSPEYQDLNFKLNIPTKKWGTFTLFGLGGNSNITIEGDGEEGGSSFDTPNSLTTKSGSSIGIVALTHRIFLDEKSNIFTTLSATYQSVSNDLDSVYSVQKNEKQFYGEDNKEHAFNVSTRYSRKFNASNTFNIGANVESHNIDYADSVNTDGFEEKVSVEYLHQIDIEKNNLMLLQGYGEWQHKFTNQFALYGGLHYNYFIFNSTSSLDPRASLTYTTFNKTKFSLGYGLHSQIQPLYVYFIDNYIDEDQTYVQTNNNLDFAKSHHFVASADYKIAPNVKLKIEAYYQALFDIAVSNDEDYPFYSALNSGSSFNQERMPNLVNKGTGKNQGIEFTLEKYLDKNYYYLATVSLFDSKYRGYDNIWRNTEFNTNFVVNALGGYEFKIGRNSSIDINMRAIWSGGRRNLYIDLEKSIALGEETYDHSRDYEDRENDYFRLDFRVSYKKNSKRITQEWALDATNFTNHKNVYGRYFDTKSNQITYSYQQGLYPMFLYRMTF